MSRRLQFCKKKKKKSDNNKHTLHCRHCSFFFFFFFAYRPYDTGETLPHPETWGFFLPCVRVHIVQHIRRAKSCPAFNSHYLKNLVAYSHDWFLSLIWQIITPTQLSGKPRFLSLFLGPWKRGGTRLRNHFCPIAFIANICVPV